MGGAVKIIKSVFSSPKPAPVQVVQPQTEPKTEPIQTAQEMAQTKSKLKGSGYGGQTIMTSAAGVEDEANVQKTILGGGRKRKINA